MSLDVTRLTMLEVAVALGHHPPLDPLCPECGGALAWNTEVSGRCPEGTGYDVLCCEECEAEVKRHWVGW